MRWFSLFLLTVSLGIFAAGCTKPADDSTSSSGANTTTSVDDHADHDHEGHDHEGHDHEGHDHDAEMEAEETVEPAPTDDFGAPPAEPQPSDAQPEVSEPEISLDPAADQKATPPEAPEEN